MANLLVLLETTFLFNVIPAFAPPTWMVVPRVDFSRSEADPAILAGITAYAVMVGRLVLARLSCSLMRNRWMREVNRQNIDMVRAWPGDRKGVIVDLMLAYAFSPLPSNYIFIVYGSAGIQLWLIDLPFFVGRWVSYLTWTHTAQVDTRYLDEEAEIDGAYMGVYFIMSQVVFLALIYGFTKPNWRHLLQTKYLRWR